MTNFPIPTALLTSDLTAAHPKLVGGVINVLKNLNWPQVVAAMTFPICAGKQIINVVQFWKASKIVSPILFVPLPSSFLKRKRAMLCGC